MRIAIIGNGAREHAIVEKLATDDNELFVVMSNKNPAIAALAKKSWVCDINDPVAVMRCLKNEDIDLGFASPDSTLAAGISDALEKIGILVASPRKAAARIEWDKAFMRSLMHNNQIAGAPLYKTVTNRLEVAKVINDLGEVAVKPLGLTGGKGVRVSQDHLKNSDEAIAYAHELLNKDQAVLIEEKLVGEEFTLQAFSDGTRIATMPPVQDHKRAFIHDTGPNTGGMGSYSTGELLPFLKKRDIEEARTIMQHVVTAMKKAGAPFCGVLYGQFMACKSGVKVIEFNARFGDPEAMNALALLDTPLDEVLLSMTDGQLELPRFKAKSTVVKYLVPAGYPEKPQANVEVSVNREAVEKEGGKVYFASVYEKEGKTYTTSSRAFATLGMADTIEEAEHVAEKSCAYITGPVWHREDIGTRTLIEKRIEHMKSVRSE